MIRVTSQNIGEVISKLMAGELPHRRRTGAEMSETARDPHFVAIAEALAEPFDPREVKFKPTMIKNNRCLAMAYIDARLIQDRLDDVVGVENWEDAYEVLQDGSVVCRLTVTFGTRAVTKTDVGGMSEQPDGGDRMKAAFSDALKRAAVKFGIGRYLYRLPAQWVDYDPVKKQIVQPPQMPAWAVPAGSGGQQKPAPVPVKPAEPQKPSLPADGAELETRLRGYEAKLVKQHVCQPGALLTYVTQVGVKAGFAANMKRWDAPAIALAADVVKEFEATMRKQSMATTGGGQ